MACNCDCDCKRPTSLSNGNGVAIVVPTEKSPVLKNPLKIQIINSDSKKVQNPNQSPQPIVNGGNVPVSELVNKPEEPGGPQTELQMKCVFIGSLEIVISVGLLLTYAILSILSVNTYGILPITKINPKFMPLPKPTTTTTATARLLTNGSTSKSNGVLVEGVTSQYFFGSVFVYATSLAGLFLLLGVNIRSGGFCLVHSVAIVFIIAAGLVYSFTIMKQDDYYIYVGDLVFIYIFGYCGFSSYQLFKEFRRRTNPKIILPSPMIVKVENDSNIDKANSNNNNSRR